MAPEALQADDADLMERVDARDVGALGELFDRYGSVLLALALRILRRRSDADEVIGDVYWELWSKPGRFDPARGNLVGYLLTLTRSRALDRLRSRRRTEARQAPPSDVEPPDATPAQPTPFAAAVLAERGHRVRSALDRLGPDQRQAIELAYYSGFSHSEVAAELGQPLGTIKSRIRQGLIQLREELRSAFEGGVEP